MKKYFIFVLILLFLLISNSQNWAQNPKEKIAILGFKTINLEDNIDQITIELFKNEFTLSGEFEVLSLDYETVRKCYNVDCALAICGEYGIKKAMFGNLTAIGNKIIVSIYVVNPDSGGIYFSDRLSTIAIEDLDIVVKRLTQAVINEKSATETITKETVTVQESEDPRRRKNFYTFGLRIGYLFPFSDSYGKSPQLVSYDLVGAYEMRNYIVEARFTVRNGKYALEQCLDFSLLYVPNIGDFSPYMAGGLGVHWIDVENSDEDLFYDGNGPAFNLGGGLFLFQTYDFRLWFDVRYNYLFLLDDETSSNHGISITIGVTHSNEGKGSCFGIF